MELVPCEVPGGREKSCIPLVGLPTFPSSWQKGGPRLCAAGSAVCRNSSSTLCPEEESTALRTPFCRYRRGASPWTWAVKVPEGGFKGQAAGLTGREGP